MKKQHLLDFIEFNEERFTKRIVFKEGQSTSFSLNFMPGQALPAHTHPGSHVYIQVLQGKGVFTIDEKEVQGSPNDVILVAGDELLSFVNSGSSNVSLYVMLNKIPDDRYAQDI
ncbi:cupin domain-containing protein [Aquibacillus koreensis]|uniref:Cupin domain-containing protein n=1 Tax=Aquibacillus koreensis TaxID=279446 RepID=A0A9X3WQ47_9BACI|nr:cupin domain-containing protein [Aquibacillus koreensis]MCT2537905.1 cupin domain-containing protein [Aquibacillus koreensis]MDC3422673.1 cupin domain-containing protein [Aquibacillus koreensis]